MSLASYFQPNATCYFYCFWLIVVRNFRKVCTLDRNVYSYFRRYFGFQFFGLRCSFVLPCRWEYRSTRSCPMLWSGEWKSCTLMVTCLLISLIRNVDIMLIMTMILSYAKHFFLEFPSIPDAIAYMEKKKSNVKYTAEKPTATTAAVTKSVSHVSGLFDSSFLE